MYWFNTQTDDHGNIRVVVPHNRQTDVAESLRKSEDQGVPEHVAITLLQDQLARLQALLAPLAPLPPGAQAGNAHHPASVAARSLWLAALRWRQSKAGARSRGSRNDSRCPSPG